MLFSNKIARVVLLLVAVGIAAVLAMGVLRGISRKESQTAPPPAPDADAGMKLTDMEFTEMQQGKRAWTLRASEALYRQDEQKTLLKEVRLTFFMDDGEEIRLESREGILHAGTKNLELWGAVRAALPKGYELTSERVEYDHAQRLVFSETAIKLTGADIQLEGGRWSFGIPERRAVLEGGVKASIIPAALGRDPNQ